MSEDENGGGLLDDDGGEDLLGGPDDKDAGQEEEPTSRRGMIKMIAIGAVVVLVLAGGGTAAFLTGALDSLLGGGEAEGEGKKHGTTTASIELAGPPIHFAFPRMVVDLKSGRCKSPFLKITVVAELSSTYESRLKEVEVEVMDRFQEFLREHERGHLVGKAGTDRLRAGFMAIMNYAMGSPAKVDYVLFKEFMLQ